MNLVGGLGGLESALHIENGLIGAGREIEGVCQSQQSTSDGDDGGDAYKVADAEAGGAHGDDFAVGGQMAEPEQNPDQDRHGDGDAEEVGEGEEEDLRRVGECGTIAHNHLQDVGKVGHEENEGEERAAYERVGENFTENVAGQDAHGLLLG